MSKPANEFVLQIRPRNLSNVTNPITGEPYDSALLAGQYRDTPFKRDTRREANALLADAKAGKIGAFPPAQYKFKIKVKPVTADTIPH